MWAISKGSLQHTGDNIVALIKGLDKAPEVDDMRVSHTDNFFIKLLNKYIYLDKNRRR